jgi:hypothetical protein
VELAGVAARAVDGKTVVETRVVVHGTNAVEGQLRLQWVDPRDEEGEKKEDDLQLKVGEQTIRTELPLPEDVDHLKWLRLRVEVAPVGFRGFVSVKRVFGLTEIADFAFEIRATRPLAGLDGWTIRFQASAVDPKSQRTQSGVTWTVLDRFGGASLSDVTQKEIAPGVFEFQLPREEAGTEQFRLDACKGEFRRGLDLSHIQVTKARARIQTDKPIYQPGQLMHVRGVVWNGEGKAAKTMPVEFQVRNPKGETVFETKMAPSTFGVAAFHWRIPDGATAGNYNIQLMAEGGTGNGQTGAFHSVRVTRYELPVFTLSIEPGKAAFLPNEEAKVTVSAEYLSKKPVPGGKVRIESARRENEAAAERVAGADGKFTASVKLPMPEGSDLYDDHEFVAYYTDPVTQRSEQKRFSLRRTREALHIYLHRSQADAGLAYAVVSYADGRAAQAKVEATLGGVRVLGETNRYGVARLRLDPSAIPATWSANLNGVEVSARTGDGLERRRRMYWLSDTQGTVTPYAALPLALRAAKRVYAAGESVTLEVHSTEAERLDSAVVLRAIRADEKLAWRQTAQLRNGRVTVQVPSLAALEGRVRFEAWKIGAKRAARLATVFPEAVGLRVSANPGKLVYRPGEAASMQFAVSDSNGKAVRAALGVAIVDEAVGERARDMNSFGGRRYWFSCELCSVGLRAEIAGIGLDAFALRRPGEKIDADLDLVAEALLEMEEEEWRRGWDPGDSLSWKSIEKVVASVKSILEREGATGMLAPRNEEELHAALRNSGLGEWDPWDRPFRYEFAVQGSSRIVRLRSAGPDGKHGTADDISPGVISLPYFRAVGELIEASLRELEELPATGGTDAFGAASGRAAHPGA